MATQKRARPLSPHLQVYNLPLTARLSILHRGTGVVLTLGLILLVYWLAAAASGPEAYQQAQSLLGSWFGMLVLAGFSFSLFYHLSNGFRHLFWDAGKGLSKAGSQSSAILVIISALALTVLSWAIALLGG